MQRQSSFPQDRQAFIGRKRTVRPSPARGLQFHGRPLLPTLSLIVVQVRFMIWTELVSKDGMVFSSSEGAWRWPETLISLAVTCRLFRQDQEAYPALYKVCSLLCLRLAKVLRYHSSRPLYSITRRISFYTLTPLRPSDEPPSIYSSSPVRKSAIGVAITI